MRNTTRSHLAWFPAINNRAPSLNSRLSSVCSSATFHRRRHPIPTSHESFPSCKRELTHTHTHTVIFVETVHLMFFTLLHNIPDDNNTKIAYLITRRSQRVITFYKIKTETVHPLPDNNYNVCCIKFRFAYVNWMKIEIFIRIFYSCAKKNLDYCFSFWIDQPYYITYNNPTQTRILETVTYCSNLLLRFTLATSYGIRIISVRQFRPFHPPFSFLTIPAR